MPEPKNSLDEEAWKKIDEQMDALDYRMNKPGYTERSRKDLLEIFQKKGRIEMLKAIDKFADYVKSEIEFSLYNSYTDKEHASSFESAINEWQTNCKKIADEDLEDKPRPS